MLLITNIPILTLNLYVIKDINFKIQTIPTMTFFIQIPAEQNSKYTVNFRSRLTCGYCYKTFLATAISQHLIDCKPNNNQALAAHVNDDVALDNYNNQQRVHKNHWDRKLKMAIKRLKKTNPPNPPNRLFGVPEPNPFYWDEKILPDLFTHERRVAVGAVLIKHIKTVLLSVTEEENFFQDQRITLFLSRMYDLGNHLGRET